MSKTVLITGASKGIGLRTAQGLARSGSAFQRIVMVARQSTSFDTAVEDLRAQSAVEIVQIVADLSDNSAVAVLFQTLDEQGIQLDTIVNNAGFTKPASINEATLADFETTMRVNLFSPFLIVQNALHHKHPLSRIVNIASTAGMNGRSGWLTYSASKAAMINMSEVLRDELKPYGIDVICLSPGRCATDLRRQLAPSEDPSTIMQPEQVADIIQLMLSDTGRLLMAQNLIVRT
jgi:3-oxoacyl-[acyl-carrier protein] reductase